MVSEFVKDKVFWTRKMNLNLVKFIEKQPHIWNPKHPKYTSVDLRDRTYAEFAAIYDNQFTGQAVKDRWTNIRSTFANYLRKLNASRTKQNGEDYKVNWHLWSACQFLLKVNKKLKTESSSIDNYCEVKDEDQKTNKEDWSSEEENSLNKTSNSDVNCSAISNGILEVFKGVQNGVFSSNNTKHAKIGRVVAKKLSQMDSYNAAKVSHKIMEILLLYDRNNAYNPNNIKVE